MSWLTDPFAYDFMLRALAEAVLMGVACGLLGSFVSLRGLAFTGESMSHVLVPGAAVATAAGVSVLAGALVAGITGALVIALLLRRPDVGEDVAVGVVFTGAFAAGVILLALRGTAHDLDSLLFGSILAVDARDLWLGLAATAGAVGVCAALGRHLLLVAFDRRFAAACGLRPALLDAALLVALAAALTVALRGLGALLVLALLVAPPATARLLVGRVRTMLWVAPVIATVCAFAGLEISFHADLAAGPAVCLTTLGIFAAVLAGTAVRRLIRRRPAPAAA